MNIESLSHSRYLDFDHVVNRRKLSPSHLHDDYELYYLIDGNIKYFVNDEIFYLHKGNFLFVPKNTYHSTDSESCHDVKRILLLFGDSIFVDEMQLVLKELSQCKLIYIDKLKIHTVKELLGKIQAESEKALPFSKAMIENYIRQLLIEICRLKSDQQQPVAKQDSFIKSVSDYISKNLCESITLDMLSKKFSLSKSHLSRKFKSEMGTGLNEYIKYVRIMNAQRLLTETTLTMTEVAEKCGFNDSNYFSAVFKKEIGIAPYKYRNANKNK